MQMPSRVSTSFDDFLSHLKDPRVSFSQNTGSKWPTLFENLSIKWNETQERLMYAGVLEMAQKVFEGGVDTWRHLHVTLRWLKIWTVQFFFVQFHLKISITCQNFEMAQNSNRFCLESIFSSKLKKNRTVRILSRLKVTCKCLHVSTPPTKNFWAISRTPAYVFLCR